MLAILDETWDVAAQCVDTGNNSGINSKVDESGEKVIDWTLLYDASPKIDDAFLSDLPKVEIANLIKFIGDAANMWEGFNHIKNRYTKRKKADVTYLIACILAEAFGVQIFIKNSEKPN